MEKKGLTRRRLAYIAANMVVAGAGRAEAQGQAVSQSEPGALALGLGTGVTAKIWPGKTLGLQDAWDEFFVDQGPGNPHWNEATTPAFTEGGGGDNLAALSAATARQKFDIAAFRNNPTSASDLKAIMAAKGGPVLQQYQTLIKTLSDKANAPDSSLRGTLDKSQKWK